MYELTLLRKEIKKKTLSRYFLLGIYFINRILYGHQIMLNYEFDIKKYQKIVFLDFYKHKIENYILNYKSLSVKKYIQNNFFIVKNKTLKEYKKYIKNKFNNEKGLFNKIQLKLQQVKNDYELIRKIDQYNNYYNNIYSFSNIIKYIDNIDIKDKMCPICGEHINTKKILITDCGHIFCMDCFLPWNEDNKRCPQCRNHINIHQLTHIVDIESREKIFESYKINYLVKFLGTKLTFVIKYIYDNNKKNNKILFLSKNDNILKIVSIILNQFNIKNTIYSGREESYNDIILLNYMIFREKIFDLKNIVVMFNEPPESYLKEIEILKKISSYNLNSINSTFKFIIRGTKEEKISVIYN